MNPVPFRQQPAFRALIFGVVLAALWLYNFVFQENRPASLVGLALDLALLALLIPAFQFFYAQFTLPVRALQDRLRIWGRLLLHTRNAHGPVVFVKNGRTVEHRGEGARSGPGLVWIDTASAAVTRTSLGPKQVLGPGIHFLGPGEHIQATFSLHTQSYVIGPGQDEPIFDNITEGADDELRKRFASAQARRQMVTGLTRDGNEVIPEIQVVFRLDGSPAQMGHPGSRFGYLKESVERAARGEGVNVDPVSERRFHVGWNHLPGLIAVDLWREYLAKFTLDELFSAQFEPVPDVIQPEQPVAATATEAAPPILQREWPARVLWRLNNRLESGLQQLGIANLEAVENAGTTSRPPAQRRQPTGRAYTALEIIAYMVKARMTCPAVPVLDECGRYLKGHSFSEEFKRLRERGLRIVDVTLGGYRFDPAVEEQIVQQWRSAWQTNATSERGHVEQLEALAAESGKQQALLEHAAALTKAIQSEPAASIPTALRVLLDASHNEILTDDRLHGRGGAELTSLSELRKWVESSGNE